MRYKNKTKSIRVVLRLIVGLTTSLFVLSLTNALNAEGFTSHKGRFWKTEPVGCGDVLEHGRFKLTGNLTCDQDPAITVIGPARLNLKGYTLSGVGNNVCILITGDGAWVRNGTIEECEEGILIEKSARNRVYNVTVKNCKEGILIEESDRNKVINVRACENDRRGFRIKKSSENLLKNCLAKDNGRKGFSIEENGDGNHLVNCMAKYNGQQGFKIEEGDDNKIYDCKAIANCRDGIEIDGGSYNRVINNLVEDNGNKVACAEEDYKPWYYAGIDVTKGITDKTGDLVYPSEYNEILNNRACGNLGCVPCYDENLSPTCKARERDFWDENVDDKGDCDSNNVWQNNRVVCRNVAPECSPEPVEPD